MPGKRTPEQAGAKSAWQDGELVVAALRLYEQIALVGVRARPPIEASYEPQTKAAGRLLREAGLIVIDGARLRLRSPSPTMRSVLAGHPDPVVRDFAARLELLYSHWAMNEAVRTEQVASATMSAFLAQLATNAVDGTRLDIALPSREAILDSDWTSNGVLDTAAALCARTWLRVVIPAGWRDRSLEVVIRLLHRSGAQLRVLDIAEWFAVLPGERVLVPRDDMGEAGVGHRDDSGTVLALTRLFNDAWGAALPWEVDSNGLFEVLELLSLGLTDQQIAGRLGISERSVRRRVAEILRFYDARSRFQLGMAYQRLREAMP